MGGLGCNNPVRPSFESVTELSRVNGGGGTVDTNDRSVSGGRRRKSSPRVAGFPGLTGLAAYRSSPRLGRWARRARSVSGESEKRAMLGFVQNMFAPKASPIGVDFGTD